MPDIRVDHLSKSFSGTSVLDDVGFTVKDKEFVTLLGPSGCGKTTTLMCIAGFQTPDHGLIACGDDTFVGGRVDLPAERPQPRDGVPVLRDLAAHDRRAERGVSAARPQNGQARHPGSRRGGAGPGRARRAGRPLPAPAVRWPAAAGRAGPCHRALPGGTAARRAVLQSGRQAARASPPLAQGTAARPRAHHAFRDPRPGRGVVDERPDPGHERRAHPARRDAGGGLPAAPFAVRRRVRRPVQLPDRRRPRRAGRRRGPAPRRPALPCEGVTTARPETIAVRPRTSRSTASRGHRADPKSASCMPPISATTTTTKSRSERRS